MIAKIIRMNRDQRRAIESRARRRVRGLSDGLFALTRYIVDADPYDLIAEAEHDILSIADYSMATQHAGIEPGEKVAAFGTRNLHADDLAGWQAEMLSVAARAPKVKRAVLHIVISLQEGESWTADEREEAITIILQVLGLEQCQTIWAEHSNTSNAHLHLAVVRVDPATGQAAGTDWLIDDLHQALSIVEERQVRIREPNSLYIARCGAVYDADTDLMVRDANGQYQSGWYKALGKKHDRMPAQLRPRRADVVAVAAAARDWAELHAGIEELGVTYDRSGNGARISYGGASAKASQVHDSLSRKQLEKRLGPFEPDLARINLGYEAYRCAFDAQLAELRAERAEQQSRLDAWVAETLAALPPETSRIVRQAVRAEAEAAKASLTEAFKQAIARCTQHRRSEQAWMNGSRPAAPPPVNPPALILPGRGDFVKEPAEIDSAFERREFGWSTQYLPDGTSLFIDHRVIIIVHATDRSDAIDEALKIAAARWGNVTATGPEAFLHLVTARAKALGIPLVDAQGRPMSLAAPIAQHQKPLTAEEPLPVKSFALEGDRVRRQRINEAIEYLKRIEGLPLRRRKMSEDTPETGNTGKLEIVLQADSRRTPELARHAIFDEDSLVQQFLEVKRLEALEEWGALLLRVEINPADWSSRSLRECLPAQCATSHSASLAANDYDFVRLMNEVRDQLRRRSKYAARDNAIEATATSQDSQLQSMTAREAQQEPPLSETSPDVSVEMQNAWLRKGAAKTI